MFVNLYADGQVDGLGLNREMTDAWDRSDPRKRVARIRFWLKPSPALRSPPFERPDSKYVRLRRIEY